MGTSKFLRNASIALKVLGVALVSTELFKKSTKHLDANITTQSKKQTEINKTE
jgi:hypothetical protein